MRRAILCASPRFVEESLPLPESARIVGVMWDQSVSGGTIQFVLEDPSLVDIKYGEKLPQVDCLVTRYEDGSLVSVLA